MPQKERSDEIEAKDIVQQLLGVKLTFSDQNGGVDYRFTYGSGRTGAVEITSVTDGLRKATQNALPAQPIRVRGLTQLWSISVPDKTKLKGIEQRLSAAVLGLEAAGADTFWSHEAGEIVKRQPCLREAVVTLMSAGVRAALAVAPGPGNEPGILLAIENGWIAKGSDTAVELICAALAMRADNLSKLVAASVDERHLFVWLDRDTDWSISRPLKGDDRITQWDHFSLPTRRPDLADPIDALWIAHHGTPCGWIWHRSSAEWSSIGAP